MSKILQLKVASLGLCLVLGACGGGADSSLSTSSSTSNTERRLWNAFFPRPDLPITIRNPIDGVIDTGFGEMANGKDGYVAYHCKIKCGSEIVHVVSRGYDANGSHQGFYLLLRNNNIYAIKYDGSMDTNFGAAGIVSLGDVWIKGTQSSPTYNYLLVLPDKRLVVAGVKNNPDHPQGNSTYLISILLKDGSYDTRFGGPGGNPGTIVGQTLGDATIDASNISNVARVVLRPDGSLLYTAGHIILNVDLDGKPMSTLGGSGYISNNKMPDGIFATFAGIYPTGSPSSVNLYGCTNFNQPYPATGFLAELNMATGKFEADLDFRPNGYLALGKQFSCGATALPQEYDHEGGLWVTTDSKIIKLHHEGIDSTYDSDILKKHYGPGVGSRPALLPDGRWVLDSGGRSVRINADGTIDSTYADYVPPGSSGGPPTGKVRPDFNLSEPGWIYQFGNARLPDSGLPEDPAFWMSRRWNSSLCNTTPIGSVALAYEMINPNAVGRATTYTARLIVGGLNKSAPIQIWNGEFSINRGSYSNSPSMVKNGDVITFRTITSNLPMTTSETSFSVGCGSALRTGVFALTTQ